MRHTFFSQWARCVLLALVCGSAAAPAQTPPVPAAKPIEYMAELRKAEADVASASAPLKDSMLQMLAMHLSFVGDTEGALATQPAKATAPTLLDTDRAAARGVLAHHDVRDAVEAIAAAARGRQVVILNESHHVPRDRAFATRVMLALREIGFEYFAAETFSESTDALARRGYPLVADGHYSREPVFGDLIRQAIAAGYRPVAYEDRSAVQPAADSDWMANINLREEAQARNLFERVFAKDPKARVFVYVGYSHAMKTPQDVGEGRQLTWMAARLRAKTGIDPLSIDQTAAQPVMPALREAVFATFPGRSFVLASRAAAGIFWTASPGVDLTVVHRDARSVNGRADWLAMDGYREPSAIPARLLPQKGRRLVQAFVAHERPDAVPMDQVIVEVGKPVPKLMLPKGEYRYAVQD